MEKALRHNFRLDETMVLKEKAVVSLLNGRWSKNNCLKFKPELLQHMDSLYVFYHKQWWCYRKMLNHFKFYNALFNGMALLLIAAGMIAGSIMENSTLVACLAAVCTVVKKDETILKNTVLKSI